MLDPHDPRRAAILRVLAYAAIVFALSVVAIIAIVSLVTNRAHGASVCERHGMQKVWVRGGRSWRCKRVRQVALRVHRATSKTDVARKITPQGDHTTPSIRIVRTVPITNGLTPHERIDRAFDKVMLFPVVDEP